MTKPFMIGSANSKLALPAGVEILRSGGSALDAVEAAVRIVESNPEEMTVGLGGLPNILGVTELDASIMDGRTLKTGAVAAVKDYLHVISIARKVMEISPHVLLVGEGAERFAAATGFSKTDLGTENSRKVYEAFVNDTTASLAEGLRAQVAWVADYVNSWGLKEWRRKLIDEAHGTVNIMAVDKNGDMCTGVSTSGTPFKFPGRVGDSPIVGAGNYCDNRFGAAACTGRGELSIRLSLARSIVAYMETRATVAEACRRGLKNVRALGEAGGMTCLAMDARGNVISASLKEQHVFCYMDVDSDGVEERVGMWVGE